MLPRNVLTKKAEDRGNELGQAMRASMASSDLALLGFDVLKCAFSVVTGPVPAPSMRTQVLESQDASRSVRVFLSFATSDAPLVEAFRDHIAEQHPDIELLDHAVKNRYEQDWKRECARKIGRSDLLICLVGPATHRSQAVAWEIHHGLSLGKRVVAVNLTSEDVRVPEVLARNAIEPQHGIALLSLATPNRGQAVRVPGGTGWRGKRVRDGRRAGCQL